MMTPAKTRNIPAYSVLDNFSFKKTRDSNIVKTQYEPMIGAAIVAFSAIENT